jgi:predicted acyl esterase
VTVAMSSAAHRFAPGHRVRLQLSGGAHPRFARSTGTGEPVATATAASLVAVDIEIAHDPGQPGELLLPVAPG